MLGNFFSCSKDPFEFPEFRCDEPPDASEEMGLISPGAENLLDFLELGRVSRVTTGTTGTRSGGLRKGQSRSKTTLERERHHERLPSNSHGDWPFLRPQKRVPEVPVVSREHLAQLEKNQEVLPSRRDETHLR